MNTLSHTATRRGPVILTGLLLLSLAFPALAQSPPQGTFAETVNVDLVNIEVWVTDEDSELVPGLEYRR